MSVVGVVFPGQGSQRFGMGKDFFDAYAESRDVFQRASETLGFDMPTLCFSENDLLDRTQFTQPAILTLEIAMFEVLKKHCNFAPSFFAGHSLGEYTALVAAGVLRLEDALLITRKRGFLMQCAVAQGCGAMAALVRDDIANVDLQPILDETGASVANYNSKDQIVLSGLKEAINAASEKFAEQFPDMRVVPLNVSAPFHSRHIESVEPQFEEYLKSFLSNIQLTYAARVLSNYTGDFHTPQGLIPALVRQISSPVRWIENMQTLFDLTGDLYEVGPQRVLSKFFSSLGATVKSIYDLRSLGRVFEDRKAYAV